MRKAKRKKSASAATRPSLMCGSSSRAILTVACSVFFTLSLGHYATGGDILRAGRANGANSPSSNTTASSSNTTNATSAETAAIAQRAKDVLSRTTKALQDMQAMQAAARAAAQASASKNLGADPNHPGQQLPDVLDGLKSGGLVPDSGLTSNGVANPVTSWTGASTPVQTTDASGNTKVTVTQSQQQALLNWTTFNIGKNTTLYFDQTAGGTDVGTWIAFNKINDPSGRPSQILGAINAAGQVYVINQNGIIFGGASQVNTHALVASSLPINDNLISGGLLNNPDLQFLFTSLTVPKLSQGTMAAFTPTVTDAPFTVSASSNTHKLAFVVASTSTPALSYTPNGGAAVALNVLTDYALSIGADGFTSVTFTSTGINKIGTAPVSVTYTRRDSGDVTVQQGAILSSPTTADHVGGKVALVGQNVTNAGTILTPDGQTILAAGQQVAFVAHDSSDPTLRGLDVYVGQGGGTVTNDVAGDIEVPRGDISMTGRNVNQLGAANSTTSVSLNGRIDLAAFYNARSVYLSNAAFVMKPSASGILTFGAGSVTQILPEWASTDTVVGTTLALGSQVNLKGNVVHFSANALLNAPSATVGIDAGDWFLQGATPIFVYTSGQVYFDPGSGIEVAGSQDVAGATSENIVSAELRGTELADSPTQRTGALRSQTVQVDIRKTGTYNGTTWVGTPLANITGYVNNIQRSVGELTASGGNVTITAGDSVIMQPSSMIDVSGGWLKYSDAVVQTTRLLSGGHLYDISQATPDLTYNGIYSGFTETHSKWNITDTYTSALLTGEHKEAGYLQGGNAGAISITAPSMALDGGVYGNTVTGYRQRQNGVNSNPLSNPSMVPTSGALSLVFESQKSTTYAFYSPTPPNITVTSANSESPADPFALDASGHAVTLRADRKANLTLSPDLLENNGFGSLNIDDSDGNISIPTSTTLAGLPGGSITLAAANLDIEGKVIVPSGSLAFNVYDYSPLDYKSSLAGNPTAVTPAPNPARGAFTLGSNAFLSTSGLVVDDRTSSATAELAPLATKGGSISIASYNANLATGSRIDASGGLAIAGNGKYTYGSGGSVSISAGQDLDLTALIGGQLSLGGKITAYGGLQDTTIPSTSLKESAAGPGGSLSIHAPLIQIGGNAPAYNGELVISPDFFNQGGFSTFTLSGLGLPTSVTDQSIPAVTVMPGTTIAPVVQSQVISIGAGNETTLAPITLPQALRAPVSLTLNAVGVKDNLTSLLVSRGDLIVGNNARILLDPNSSASVTLKGNTVELLGAVKVPGGNITVSGALNSTANYLVINQDGAVVTADLGPSSSLSAAGATLLYPNPRGYRSGSVLGGGSITISGNIAAESGAIIDVSGGSAVLDLLSSYNKPNSLRSGYFYGDPTIPTRVDGNGGTITLKGGQELFSDATLLGVAGGPSALGGNLIVSSGKFTTAPVTYPSDINLIVTQTGNTIPIPFYTQNQTAIGKKILDANGVAISGYGRFSISSFEEGGFDSLSLLGCVQFTGPISISAKGSLAIASSGILFGDSAIDLSAPYISLGTSFATPVPQQQLSSAFVDSLNHPFYISPIYGAGNLTAQGNLIDIGNLSLQNIGTLNLVANNGDIRGQGTVDVSGNINITAGQINPVTAGNFTIAAYDKNIVVANSVSGNRTVTLASAVLPPGFGIGSSLLGSAVQNINGNIVTLAAGANTNISSNTDIVFEKDSGTVVIRASGERLIPLSAGGQINIYGSVIDQGGVVRAPLGIINIGWDGAGTVPQDWLTGYGVSDAVAAASLPVTSQLTLSQGGQTSISAYDPVTGAQTVIPYGINLNGISWIAPTGVDITAIGVPSKAINVSAQNITDQNGSTIDLRGAGDMYAYRWVSGTGGSLDILASTSSFAVLPGYGANYTPFAPFNNTSTTISYFGSDQGYVNNSLKIGDSVFLNASSGLAAGFYTLLPARYALLPGAFLVTPESGIPARGSVPLPGGSTLVSGYRLNDLNTSRTLSSIYSNFKIESSSVVRTRAEYDNSYANAFISSYAQSNNTAVSRLPEDSGQLVLNASKTISLQGTVLGNTFNSGRGGLIDISSPLEILIVGSSGGNISGKLVLKADELSAFGAESLLIGGVRQTNSNGISITVSTNNLTVDNAGCPLKGSDVILVANNSLTLAPGADVESLGSPSSGAENILLGSSSVAGSGNGLILRVSTDPNATVARSSINSSLSQPMLTIGAGAIVDGDGVVLDSSYGFGLDASATLAGKTVYLKSSQTTIQLNDAGTIPATSGLALGGSVLNTLQSSVETLDITSYSTLDIYGNGQIGGLDLSGNPELRNLNFHTPEIRGFNTGGNTVTFAAQNILLDNPSAYVGPLSGSTLAGTLEFKGNTLTLGANNVSIGQYANVNQNLSNYIAAQAVGGLITQGALSITTPALTGQTGANYTITAGGALAVHSGGTAPANTVQSWLGAELNLVGQSVTSNANIFLPSGILTLHATTGDVTVGNETGCQLNVAGIGRIFQDVTKYTSGGQLNLISDAGNVNVFAGSTLDVSSQSTVVNSGLLSISAPAGNVSLAGAMRGTGGSGGTFSLDVGSLTSLSSINSTLNLPASGFTLSRSFRVRTGSVSVDGPVVAHEFDLIADQGSITVSSLIDASGATGGLINFNALGNITLANAARLTVEGVHFDDAGKGGSISLATTQGRITIGNNSSMELKVDANSNAATTAANAALGDFNGTVHLRAPQVSSNTDIAIDPIAASINNASNIVVEGFYKQDANTTGVASIDNYETAALSNANSFMTHASAIQSRLVPANSPFASVFNVQPGEEIDNSGGGLVLNNDWDLSTWRFGSKKNVIDSTGALIVVSGNQVKIGAVPGILTLRAAGSITLNGMLSDGFGNSAGTVPTTSDGYSAPWKETLLPRFSDGTSQLSWSFNITSGADFSAANIHQVLPLSQMGAQTGSVLIGKFDGTNAGAPSGSSITDSVVEGYYQVIRTGAGNINISSARDVQFQNEFATIYTAGTLVSDPTMGGLFDVPILYIANGQTGALGAIQEATPYPAQYSYNGGNVVVDAQNDILHVTMTGGGAVIADSSKEIPVNWLYRRGYVNPVTGNFGTSPVRKNGTKNVGGDVESTTWWVDFSNFFEGVAALGGGNVSLNAGRDIANVDALVPTNARMIGKNSGGSAIAPNAANLVELGGGDVSAQAGRNIDAGIYYVERGDGTLSAGNKITTNSTRSPSLGIVLNDPTQIYSPLTWLPTSLFLGKGSFNISANSDLLLGSVANVFLLPEGYSNTYWYKTFFSTYASTDSVNVSSLSGVVTLRESAAQFSFGIGKPDPILLAWLENVSVYQNTMDTVSLYQPWLRLDESSVNNFSNSVSLLPPAFTATAFNNDINLVGSLNLWPSPTGTVDLLANGAVNGLQPGGTTMVNGLQVYNWLNTLINLSDANPSNLPGIASPYAFQIKSGTNYKVADSTDPSFLLKIDQYFAETGATQNVTLTTKVTLHAPGPLHINDADPVRIYAENKNISGIELFSGKAARIVAGQDITDVALYIQNATVNDISVVSAGRDIIAYDPNSPLRQAAQALADGANLGNIQAKGVSFMAGDLQIAGPGTLEVLAGRNLDLGVGASNPDGTARGLVSIGNVQNPYLPFAGANIIAGAGIGSSAGLNSSSLDFSTFINDFLNPATSGNSYSQRYLTDLGAILNLGSDASDATVWSTFEALPEEKKDAYALNVFYFVLRDAGRDHNDPTSSGYKNYNAGKSAIAALFPSSLTWNGNISLTSREIKTKNGGDISLFAPGGNLAVGYNVAGTQALDQGILTEHGGNISIFTRDSVNVGTSRIFTLRGGNEIIWSSLGDIAAGASSKTVQSAPPTRVLLDPQSGDVITDLSGLATGGGIGVLATVKTVPPGDVDLIAPSGAIDAGDAGIRASGNLNISAVQILNASNIQVGGASNGTPVVVAPNLNISLTTQNINPNPNNQGDNERKAAQQRADQAQQEMPSLITVEVIGYGGGEGD